MRFTRAAYDVVDEATVAADPATVFHALVNEVRGVTHWWRPHFEAKPRDPERFGQVGSIVDVQIRWIFRPWFSARVVEARPGRLFRVEFFRGSFVGDGVWTFEPVDSGTAIRFRWQVRCNQWRYTLVHPFVDLAGIHSKVVQAGFDGLDNYLAQAEPRVEAALAVAS